MARTYFGKTAGWRQIVWSGSPWGVRRWITLSIRHNIDTHVEMTPAYENDLVQAILKFYETTETSNGKYYWVANYSPHDGPCHFCLKYQERYRRSGATFEELVSLMTDPAFIAGHRSSRLGGQTYSRILMLDEIPKHPEMMNHSVFGDMSNNTGEPDDSMLGEILQQITRDHETMVCSVADQRAARQMIRERYSRVSHGYDVTGFSFDEMYSKAYPGGAL